jgi:4-oxalocrotonate tautomerase
MSMQTKSKLIWIAASFSNTQSLLKESFMPYINLQITKGATVDQKKQVVAEFTQTLVNVLGKKPEHIHIVIQEIELDDWGYCGQLTSELRKQE